ncbi:hypothetical protein ACERK3_09630 [Phycisphaerales bacterium AB-hyl4]|uniref:Uncharacterized protein n=1 Tax=Natronomicrosphaera hydrolytica TaxID=3242702 RepID=A0ABV4U5W2_9BACT
MLKRLLFAVPMLFAVTAAPALAQDDVSPAPETQQWVPLVLSLLLCLLAGSVSFLSSRRTHQD